MLHFDDGTVDHHDTVAPLLAKHGFRAVFFISTAKLGNEGYLSESDVRAMAEAGHVIECHGHSHRRMDRMSGDELAGELRRSVEEIHRLTGRRPRIIAPPGGFVSKRVVEIASRMGMPVVRTMRWNVNPLPLRGSLDCLVVHHGTTPQTISRWIDGKGLCVLKIRYLVKQLVRAAMPLDLYLALRHRLVRERKPAN
jgi:peptidoglycan/xylan/chitin deacetylase (PgdA/CDA1 family)